MTVPIFHPLAETEATVLLSRADWEAVNDLLDDLRDGIDIVAIRQRLAAGETEEIPWEIAERLLDGESRIKVWREYRGLTLAALVEASGVAADTLARIEATPGSANLDAMIRIARALAVDVADLVSARSAD